MRKKTKLANTVHSKEISNTEKMKNTNQSNKNKSELEFFFMNTKLR